jgi:large subunit ribosomal protein L22
MDVTALSKYVRISWAKAEDLARAIQGLPALEALKVVQFSPRKGARLIERTLRSAIANAENNLRLHAEDLTVKSAAITPGPSFKRYWPRARGAASPIRKRTSHIRITLTDEAKASG